MDTSQAFSRASASHIYTIRGAAVAALLTWAGDDFVPPKAKGVCLLGDQIFQLVRLNRAVSDRPAWTNWKHLRTTLRYCLPTCICIAVVPSHLQIRIQCLVDPLIIDVASALWLHLKSDSAANPEYGVWCAARNAALAYAATSLALAFRTSIGVAATASLLYVCIPLIYYLVALWLVTKWTRFPAMNVGIFQPLQKLLLVLGDCITRYRVVEAILVESLPKAIQRTRIRFAQRWSHVQAAARHEYKPLKSGHIRLLLLKRSSGPLSGMIKAELLDISMNRVHQQSDDVNYEAVSYCWGGSSRDKLILINDRIFYVTKSAFELLLARRSVFRDRLIWIDAICINQEDKVEKSHQIALMRNIYQGAARVIIFLGTGWRIRCAAQVVYEMHLAFQLPWMDLKYSVLQYPLRRSLLTALLSNEYFTRVWIIQEIFVAGKVELYLAGHYMSWETFAETSLRLLRPEHRHLLSQSTNLDMQPWSPSTPFGSLSTLYALNGPRGQESEDGLQVTLENILFLTTVFNATDPRDRLYALLGVLKPAKFDERITPDYFKSCEQIYEDLARYLFIYQETPSILTMALAGTGGSRPRRELPSWVPDLSQERINDPYADAHFRGDPFQASGNHRPVVVEGPYPKTLALKGILCDRIVAISQAGFMDLTPRSNEGKTAFQLARSKVDFVNAAIELVREHSHLWSSGAHLALDRLWNVLITNRLDTRRRRPGTEYKAVFQQWLDFWTLLARVDTYRDLAQFAEREDLSKVIPNNDDYKAYDYNMRLACVGRCFAISEKGNLCLVPPKSEVGDRVFIPYGAPTPFTIRVCENKQQPMLFELVGEAYVDGIMEGEALDTTYEEVTVVLK